MVSATRGAGVRVTGSQPGDGGRRVWPPSDLGEFEWFAPVADLMFARWLVDRGLVYFTGQPGSGQFELPPLRISLQVGVLRGDPFESAMGVRPVRGAGADWFVFAGGHVETRTFVIVGAAPAAVFANAGAIPVAELAAQDMLERVLRREAIA